MVMEYVAGGELFDYIVKHGKVSSVMQGFRTFLARDPVCRSWILGDPQAHIHVIGVTFP